ncbi:MAG TPA: hypothetical protein VGL27_08960 [Negativicutes bacterium]|jgi:hypothetical protein
MEEWNELKTYTLIPEELEALLLNDFGNKLQPVDSVKLAKQRQQQAATEAYKNRFRHPKSIQQIGVCETDAGPTSCLEL